MTIGLRRCFSAVILTGICITCFTTSAFAVDGVVLIDQNRALAGNVTPGDAPGFPVTISLSGSYRLSGNLTVPAGVGGIVIGADHVTLDLNGFRIAGGASDGAAGVEDSGFHQAIVVRNGSVTGFAFGIHLERTDGAEIAQIRVSDNVFGISVGSHATVTGNVASKNSFGIAADDGSIVTGNNVFDNQQTGLATLQFSLVNGNTASRNGIGIRAICPSNLVANTSLQNDTNLVQVLEGSCHFANNHFGATP